MLAIQKRCHPVGASCARDSDVCENMYKKMYKKRLRTIKN